MSELLQFDAIVVGSGITGGWAAKELTESGLKVLLLERGRHVEHGTGYKTEHIPPWKLPFRGLGNQALYSEHYPIQSQHFLFDEYTQDYFVKDSDSPYVSEKNEPFQWFRGHQLGGRSLTWGRQSYRLSDLDFTASIADRQGVDWPIRYRDIAPWYNYVEEFIGVSGQAEGLSQLPDGKFLPPMKLNCVEEHFKQSVNKTYPGRTATIGRAAVLTQPHRGRGACHYCGPCERGCSVGAYFSTQSSTLPAAKKTGNLTLVSDTIVERLRYDAATQRVSGVEVIDAKTKQRRVYTSSFVFLCASTLASTQILLNSKSQEFPNGLANHSGVLGHYLMDHGTTLAGVAHIPGFESHSYEGNRPNAMYIPRFRNIDKPQEKFYRGYGLQGMAWRQSWMRGVKGPEYGAALKKSLRAPGPWLLALGAFIESLPRYENSVKLDNRKTDRWGIPQLHISYSHGVNEQLMAEDAQTQTVAMLEAAGGKMLMSSSQLAPGGSAIHEMGTARMGNSPKDSVLNAYNQSHDVPNLFITDGSCMTSSACQNPSLTYMALTARACRFAVEQLRAGEFQVLA